MKKTALIVLSGVMAISLYSQEKFIKHYGSFTGEGNSVILNSTSKYVIAGIRNNQFCTYMINAMGDTLWTKQTGGINSDKALQIIQTADGGYASIGSSSNMSISNIYFVKANGAGTTVWTKQIGGLGEENATAIIQLSTGGYMIGGRTNYNSHGLFDLYILKTDANGDTLWTKKIGGPQNEEIQSMKQTADGNFIISGYTRSYTNGSDDCYLVKINPNGDTLWSRHYGGSLQDRLAAVRQTSDGGYVMAGYSNSFGVASQNMYVIKTNASGDTLWTKTYGQSGRYSLGYDIIQTNDGGYAITGTIRNTNPNGSCDVYLVKTDAAGNVQWEKEFKPEPLHTSFSGAEGRSLIQTMDNGFAISGAWANGLGYELLFIKTDGNGGVGMRDLQAANVACLVFPNPFTQYATLKFDNPRNAPYSLKLFNNEGRLIRNMTGVTSGCVEIERADLPGGTYFFGLQNEDGDLIAKGKLVIE